MTHTLTLPSICRSVTYILWSSDFASYLEDYLMEKRCTWDNRSLWLKDRPCKIYAGQWPIFHGPLILPYNIVRLKLFLYIKKWHWPGVFVPLRALALVFICTCRRQDDQNWYSWSHEMYFKNLFLELAMFDIHHADKYWVRPKMLVLRQQCTLFLDKCPFIYIRG